MQDEIEKSLRNARFTFTNEKELQQGIYEHLSVAFDVQREVTLSDTDRIDFMVGNIGVEVKVDGSRANLLRQLYRYSQSSQVAGLILVTNRARFNEMPNSLNDKPLIIVNLLLENAF